MELNKAVVQRDVNKLSDTHTTLSKETASSLILSTTYEYQYNYRSRIWSDFLKSLCLK